MPDGLYLYRNESVEPQFLGNELTLENGNKLFLACLTVFEEIQDPMARLGIATEEEEVVSIYAPKSLVFLSQHDQFELFRKLLLYIYRTGT